jgi:hypothetical protein
MITHKGNNKITELRTILQSMVTTNIGSFNFDIENFFSSLKVTSIQNGRPITTTQTSTIDMKNTTKYCFILYIMMSGDVHYNPGPIRYPCAKCKQPVKSNQKALQCDFCDHWTHLRCTTITVKEYHILAKCDDQYFCHTVMLSGYSLQVVYILHRGTV